MGYRRDVQSLEILEIKCVCDRRKYWKERQLYQSRTKTSILVFAALVNHIGIFAVIEVIDTDVDGPPTFFELTMEIDTDVHTVVVGQTEVVTVGNVTETLSACRSSAILVGVLVRSAIAVKRQCGSVSRREDPGRTQIESF